MKGFFCFFFCSARFHGELLNLSSKYLHPPSVFLMFPPDAPLLSTRREQHPFPGFSYLFRALLLFHAIPNDNVNNFPPEPLDYSLEAALLPCGGVTDNGMLVDANGTAAERHRRLARRRRVTRAPLRGALAQNRAECKHLELRAEMR